MLAAHIVRGILEEVDSSVNIVLFPFRCMLLISDLGIMD